MFLRLWANFTVNGVPLDCRLVFPSRQGLFWVTQNHRLFLHYCFNVPESTLKISILPKYNWPESPTLDRHAFEREAWILGTEAKKASFNRKQPGYKPPDSLVEPEKSSESRSRAPGFICGVAFFNSLIENRKSKIDWLPSKYTAWTNRLIVNHKLVYYKTLASHRGQTPEGS